MSKRIFILAHRQARAGAELAIRSAPDGYVVTISEPTRTLEQNAKLYAMLGDVAKQVVWHGQKLTAGEWKDVFTAALRRQKAVPGLDGGFVICGQSTSKMGKREFADLIELIYAFGGEHGVQWSEPVPEWLGSKA